MNEIFGERAAYIVENRSDQNFVGKEERDRHQKKHHHLQHHRAIRASRIRFDFISDQEESEV
jgi:hypothetical protein